MVEEIIVNSKWRKWAQEKRNEFNIEELPSHVEEKMMFRNVVIKIIDLFYKDEPRDAFHLL